MTYIFITKNYVKIHRITSRFFVTFFTLNQLFQKGEIFFILLLDSNFILLLTDIIPSDYLDLKLICLLIISLNRKLRF